MCWIQGVAGMIRDGGSGISVGESERTRAGRVPESGIRRPAHSVQSLGDIEALRLTQRSDPPELSPARQGHYPLNAIRRQTHMLSVPGTA